MLHYSKLALVFILLVVLQGCYTSANLSTINIEVLVPGTLRLTQEYKNPAVRYNNCNISSNPLFSGYYEDNDKLSDTTNLDSIAAEIYLQNFIENIRYQQYFDTVIDLGMKEYSDFKLSDSLLVRQLNMFNSTEKDEQHCINAEVVKFAKMAGNLLPDKSAKPETVFIDPEFCLYSANDIRQIADTTEADLLLSFDFFALKDGIFTTHYNPDKADTSGALAGDLNIHRDATEVVNILSGWSFYDLKKQKLIYWHQKTDTIKWNEPAYNIKMAKRILPSRWDAVLNAADIAGNKFAEFLVPNWLEVERDYYKFSRKELKSADSLMMQNRWMEAAEIYRKNTQNRNRKIASKSMYNMGLLCEMKGEMDAAIDWVTKSMNTNHKDPYHKGNCDIYLVILDWRKQEIQKIEN
jgi:hypothetical protein